MPDHDDSERWSIDDDSERRSIDAEGDAHTDAMDGRETKSTNGVSRKLSRRKTMLLASSLALTAGCASSGGGDGATTATATDAEDDTGTGSEADMFTMSIRRKFDNLNWNIKSDNYINAETTRPLWVAAAGLDLTGSDVNEILVPFLWENWEYSNDPNYIEMTFRESTWWASGNTDVDQRPISVEDLVMSWEMDKFIDQTDNYSIQGLEIEEIETVDNHTVRVHPASPVPKTQALLSLANIEQFVPRAEPYLGFFERYQDATTEEAQDEISAELKETALNLEQAYGTGPLKPVDVSGTRILCEPNKGYWGRRANNGLTFDRFEIRSLPEAGVRHSAMTGGEIDGGRVIMTDQLEESLPDFLEHTSHPRPGGRGFIFNHSNELSRDPDLHKAIAHMIDHSQISKNLWEAKPVTENFSGLPSLYEQEWFSDEFLDSLESYWGVNHDLAELYLKRAGLEKNNDVWLTPDGEEFVMDIVSFPSREVYARGSASFIEQFGIETEVFITQNAWTQMGNSNFTFGTWDFAHRGEIIPLEDLSVYWTGWMENVSVHTGDMDSVQVPPIGQPQADRTKEIPLRDLISEAKTLQTSDQRYLEILEELSWAFNQTLPCIPLVEDQLIQLVNSRDWGFAGDANVPELAERSLWGQLLNGLWTGSLISN